MLLRGTTGEGKEGRKEGGTAFAKLLSYRKQFIHRSGMHTSFILKQRQQEGNKEYQTARVSRLLSYGDVPKLGQVIRALKKNKDCHVNGIAKAERQEAKVSG